MAATLTAVSPGEIPFRLTIAFTLNQWKEVRAVLTNNPTFCYPVNELTDAIRNAVNQAEKTYYAEQTVTPAKP